MNYSSAVFLINKNVRAIVGIYETDELKAPKTIYKTLDQTIKKGDFVIVPSGTRHHMTVVKVVDTDVEIDFDSNVQLTWIVGLVDKTGYNDTVAMEDTAIKAMKSAELRKKKSELAEALFKDQMENLRTLEIADMNGTAEPSEESKPQS